MARDVEADVNINDKSGKGLSSFLANLRKTSDQVKSTTKETDKASAATAALGGKADENAKAFHKLSSELEISKKELGNLARAFADAGTAAERVDITKAMRKQQTEIRNLSKNANILKDLLPDQDIKNLGQRLTGELKDSFSGLGEFAGPAIAIGIAGASPLIGATIAGAILGGAGAGGVVGGVIIAAKDPRVQQAFAEMKSEIGKELTDSAQPFVATTIDGIDRIGAAVKGIDFASIFDDASHEAGPLIRGVTDLVTDLGGAFADLVHNAGPVVDEIGDAVGDFGRVVSGGLKSLTDNGDDAAKAIADVAGTINVGIEAAFGFVNVLTEVYGALNKIGGVSVFDLFGKINYLQHAQALGQQSVADTAQAAAVAVLAGTSAVDQYGQAILTDGEAIESFTQKLDDLASSGRSLFDTTTQVGAAIDNVTAAAKKNGKTLDENTPKGRANRDALSSLAGALIAQYDATVKVNGEGTKSNAVAASNRAEFIKLATQFTGSASAAEELANKMGLIKPKSVKVNVNTHDAEARAEALQEQINALHGKSIAIAVSTNIASVKRKVDNTLARLGGGLYNASGSFAFAAPGSTNRTEAPRPVNVTSNVESKLYLDGSLVYATTARQVRANSKRDAWRQKVGRR